MKIFSILSLCICLIVLSSAFSDPPPTPYWENVGGVAGQVKGNVVVFFDGDCNDVPPGQHPVFLYVEADGNGENADLIDWNNFNANGNGYLHAGFTEWENVKLPPATSGWAFYFVIITPDHEVMSSVVWVSK